jgi:hypothetical protein
VIRRTAPRRPPHPFTADVHPDWAGRPVCTCGQLDSAAVHKLPDTDPAVAATEARRLGEHPDREDT